MRKDELWQQEAKKLGGESLVEVIEEIRDGQRAMLDRLKQMDERHSASEAAIASINRAFPSADFEGHRRYHETMIEMISERRRLRMAIQEKTISGLIWAGIVGVSLAVWHELISVFGKGG